MTPAATTPTRLFDEKAAREAHVEAALHLPHAFRATPKLPEDLQFALHNTEQVKEVGSRRAAQWNKVEELAKSCTDLDRRLWQRMHFRA